MKKIIFGLLSIILLGFVNVYASSPMSTVQSIGVLSASGNSYPSNSTQINTFASGDSVSFNVYIVEGDSFYNETLFNYDDDVFEFEDFNTNNKLSFNEKTKKVSVINPSSENSTLLEDLRKENYYGNLLFTIRLRVKDNVKVKSTVVGNTRYFLTDNSDYYILHLDDSTEYYDNNITTKDNENTINNTVQDNIDNKTTEINEDSTNKNTDNSFINYILICISVIEFIIIITLIICNSRRKKKIIE